MTWDGLAVSYAAARWLGYLAAFLVVGSVVFVHGVLRRAVDDPEARADLARRAALVGLIAAGLLVVAQGVRLHFQARSLLEPGEPVTSEFIGAILGTAWGRGWVRQTAAALVAMLGGGLGIRRRGFRHLLSIGALGIVATAPLTGHAVALPQAGRLGYPLDLLHFGLGAAWLGTLAVMSVVSLSGPGSQRTSPRNLVTAFSPLALVTGITAIALGLVIAWRYLGALEPFVDSLYGRTVLLKLLALGGVALLGGYNWRVVQPRLSRGLPAPVGRTVTLELALGVILIAVTAVLVALPLPGEE